MNAHVAIKPPDKPRFDPHAAYERERESNRILWDCLTKVLIVAEAMIREAAHRGEDVTTRRVIVENARQARWGGA